jgi:hypothetical protein
MIALVADAKLAAIAAVRDMPLGPLVLILV